MISWSETSDATALLRQYEREIRDAVDSNLRSDGGINYTALRSRILQLQSNAYNEGITSRSFQELLEIAVPGETLGALHLTSLRSAA